MPHGLVIAFLLIVTLAVTAFYLRTALNYTDGVLGTPLDDAWIHFQFARNISSGNGFSYNVGEPMPGSTAPLWTMLLAATAVFQDDLLLPALLLSVGFLLATVILAYGFVFELSGNQLAAFLAGLGIALAGRLQWAGLSGMEVTAFAAFALAAVWVYTRQGLRPFSALLFGLATQLRPEGHALFALALLDTGWTFVAGQTHGVGFKNGLRRLWRWSLLKRLLKQIAIPLFLYALISAPYIIFSLATTGNPLPNTFYAKAGTEYFFSWQTLQDSFYLHWTDNPISLLLLLLGVWPTWRKSRLTLLWLFGLFLLTPIVVDLVWHHGRYTMPLIPFQMIVAAMGVDWLLRGVQRRVNKSWVTGITAVLLTLLLVMGGMWQLGAWANMLAQNTKEIQDIDIALGTWLAENTEPDVLLAVDDIGAVTYFSGRRILDLHGLVSPEMWVAERLPIGLEQEQLTMRILADAGVDYLVGFPDWHWAFLMGDTAVYTPIYTVETATHTIIFQPQAGVYKVNTPYTKEAIPQRDVDFLLGEAIRLIGMDFALADGLIDLTLYWQSEAELEQDYDVFIHIVDEEGNIVAQVDRQPANGLAPTRLWVVGDVVRDPYPIILPAELPAGTYQINVGMFLRATGARLPIAEVEDDIVPLLSFEIP